MGHLPPSVQREPAPKRALRPPIQASLVVGAANDPFEHEADRVADQVMSGSQGAPPSAATPPPVISRVAVQRMVLPPGGLSGPEATDEVAAPEERAQRSSRMRGPEAPSATPAHEPDQDKIAQPSPGSGAPVGAAGGTASSDVEAAIDRIRARPAPGLDGITRRQMEGQMGADLTGARVHADAEAGQAATSLGARAFTVGQDMFFAPGEYQPQSAQGQRLIAHELTHTIQQAGGTAGARRVQRALGAEKASKVKTTDEPGPLEEVTLLEDKKKEWSIDLAGTGPDREIHVPKLELPKIAGALKGAKGGEATPASATDTFPLLNKPYVRSPQEPRAKRAETAASELWMAAIRKNAGAIETKLGNRLKRQKSAASITEDGKTPVYVLKQTGTRETRTGADPSQFLLVGTLEELAHHDSIVRPMLTKSGSFRTVDADHVLDDQLGGLDTVANLWLLDRHYNRSIGPQMANRIKASINTTIEEAKQQAAALKKKGAKVDGRRIPQSAQMVLRNWTLVFNKVVEGKYNETPKTWWTRTQVEEAAHVKHFEALTERELFEQGFKFDEKKKVLPTAINLFPRKDGGYRIRFEVTKDGKHLKKPERFYRGLTVVADKIEYQPPSSKNQGQLITTLKLRYQRQEDKKRKKPPLDVSGDIDVRHDPRLGFGGYISRFEIVQAAVNDWSPLTFADVAVTPDGDLAAHGTLETTKALLPGSNIPLELRGTDILVNFPVPAANFSLGPLTVSDVAVEVGAGQAGLFLAGSAGIAITDVGQGSVIARVDKDDVVLEGEFALDLTFAEPALVKLRYSLQNDELSGEATLGVKKGTLPGVEGGQVVITVSREAFGLTGTLNLGGVMAGSVVTIGYTRETGLLIEGKDLPLPVGKLPGVSEAKATVRARRHPETGEWAVAGGGKAVLAAAGATGTLDVMVNGAAVTIKGRADVTKGPASGWLEITATNQATDDEGNPLEGAPVGELRIWGKGAASIKFGKILTGTAGLEYTPDGRVVLVGEIALPPKFDLFPKLPLGKPKTLLSVHPPDFWIWGVKVGPVGFGIFAFVDASLSFESFVGPGQLLDTKVAASLDLDKPEEAKVTGRAVFYVPALAQLKLDVGGGVKAQVAVAYVKGRVGLDGTLGIAAEVRLPVDVSWSKAQGLAFGGKVTVSASPKFELGVNASISAGVDLGLWNPEKTWGPWRKKLGEFGPNMALSADFPLRWSEQTGLSFDTIDPKKKPDLDAKSLMGDAFDALV